MSFWKLATSTLHGEFSRPPAPTGRHGSTSTGFVRIGLLGLREQMAIHDIDALILFVGENVRYVTSVFQGNWKNNIFIRYAVLPREGDPILFETVGSDKVCAEIDAPWLKEVRPAITWKWGEGAEEIMAEKMADSIVDALKENGVADGRVGIDIMDFRAYESLKAKTSSWSMRGRRCPGARTVKTPDEIECLKIAVGSWGCRHVAEQ